VAVRGNWVFARAGSDLFDFVQDQFTLEDGAFDAPGITADVALAVHPRVDAVAGLEFSRAEATSEYRRFVDNNRLPITQTTSLDELNLSGTIRFGLVPRGRQVSRYAWVPRTVVPYVGAGAGAMYYDFQQVGDFVDFVDLSVFSDTFQASGWTPTAHVLGGVDVRVFQRWYLSLEGRYLWGAGELSREFQGFDPMDLAGLRFGIGVNVLF
jgi:hypothetical protein